MKRVLALLMFIPMFAIAAEPPTKEIVCRACHGAAGAAPLMVSQTQWPKQRLSGEFIEGL